MSVKGEVECRVANEIGVLELRLRDLILYVQKNEGMMHTEVVSVVCAVV